MGHPEKKLHNYLITDLSLVAEILTPILLHNPAIGNHTKLPGNDLVVGLLQLLLHQASRYGAFLHTAGMCLDKSSAPFL